MNSFLTLLLMFSFAAWLSHSSERDFTSERPFTIEEFNDQPQSLEETLHYAQFYTFLSNNEQALHLLESARRGEAYYHSAQSEFNRYLINPLSDSSGIFELISNNADLKLSAELEGKILGTGLGVEAELDLKALGSDLMDRLTERDYNKKIKDTAQYYTRETYACIETPHLCSMNALPHQRQAMMIVQQHFAHFPRAVDQNGRLLSFEEKAMEASPAQAAIANALFNAMTLQNISSQAAEGSEENKEETIQSRDKILKTMDTHIQNVQEESHREMERREQMRRQNFKEMDPDYMDEDLIVLAENNKIKQWRAEKDNLSEDLKQGKISQEKYNQEIESIDRTIETKQTDLEVYKFRKNMKSSIAWAGAAAALARSSGMPEEVVRFSQAAEMTLQTFDVIGSMFIAGAIDPTKLTLAFNSISGLINVVSGTPSTSQMMAAAFNRLIKGQGQILSKLNEIDHKLEGMDSKLNGIIEMLNMSHQQITQQLDYITDELHRVENEIILAIEEKASASAEESRNSGAFFADDGRVVLDVLKTWNYQHLDQIAAQCRQYKDQYDQNGNLRFYDDYNWCMDKARTQLSMIEESLSDLYLKAENRFGTETYVQFRDIDKMSEAQLSLEWNEAVEERVGLLPSIFQWMSRFYSMYAKTTEFWAEDQDNVQKGVQFAKSIQNLRIKHPRFYDEVFTVYAPLTQQLPRPEHLSFIKESKISDYVTKHLLDICENLRHIEDLSFYNRENLNKAWWIYLYLSDQMKRRLDQLFEYNLTKLLETYGKKKKVPPQQDCNCNSVHTQTEKAFFDYMSIQKQTDIFQYIENQGYNTHKFLELDPEEIAQKAFDRPHITNSYLINEGFYKTVRGSCLKVRKPGADSSSKKVPYTEADLEIEEQRTHYNETVQRLNKENKCWITDPEGHIKGLPRGSSFQLEEYVSFKNIVGRQEKELRRTCLSSKRPLDSMGAGAVIGGILGGATGLIADVFTAGASGGAGIMGGASAGAVIGGIWDGIEYAASLCETAELRKAVLNNSDQTPNLSDLESWTKFLNQFHYNKKPLTSYLQSYPVTRGAVEIPMYPYYFVCKKKACLKFGTKKIANKKEWMQTAAEQIRQTQGYLNNRLKDTFKNGSMMDYDGTFKQLRVLLRKSALALDTMARAGYGQTLKDQPELSEMMDELKIFTKKLDDPTSEDILKLVQTLRYLPDEIPRLPIQGINTETPPGLGNTEDRRQALGIILNRNYFSPRECRELKKERKQ